jgi:hypothetical protein
MWQEDLVTRRYPKKMQACFPISILETEKCFPKLLFFTMAQHELRPPHCRGFMITLRHTTLGSTPLDEWSARRRDLHLITHNTQTTTPPVGFKPTIPASERPQTHASDRAAIGIGFPMLTLRKVFKTTLNISDEIHRSYTNLSVVSRTDI